jgi:hypothetical protein
MIFFGICLRGDFLWLKKEKVNIFTVISAFKENLTAFSLLNIGKRAQLNIFLLDRAI